MNWPTAFFLAVCVLASVAVVVTIDNGCPSNPAPKRAQIIV